MKPARPLRPENYWWSTPWRTYPRLNAIENFQLTIDDGVPGIRVNKIKMCRALINLLENALEAMDGLAGAIAVTVGSAW